VKGIDTSLVRNSCAAKCRLLSLAFLMKVLFDVYVKNGKLRFCKISHASGKYIDVQDGGKNVPTTPSMASL